MSTSTVHRKPYTGTRRKLVVAFDVGTTFSGASYSILDPGQSPEIRGVSGQQKVAGDSKIPSVVCYDEDGTVVAVGSETDPDTNPELFEARVWLDQNGTVKHLFRFPQHSTDSKGLNCIFVPLAGRRARIHAGDLPPLPRGKTAIAIYSDVLRYLFDATKRYIQERQGRYVELAIRMGGKGDSNRDAECGYLCGLVKNEAEALDQVSFVTEGEASLHYCLNNIPTVLERLLDDGVMVVDCGGGTIDISTYTRASDRSLKEISAAECLLQGSTFVTGRAEQYLKSYLHGSKFGGPEEIATMKREKVASFFDPSVKAIIETIEDQCSKSRTTIKAICLVGGFATSDYLFSRLDGHFKERDIQILRPDRYL
ncbi:hypothetical protein F5887DRAFT_917458, partial [Amanita rubescens]